MKLKFKAGDSLVDKYTECQKTIRVVSCVAADGYVLDKPVYIIDYEDGEPSVIRSKAVIEKYYKLAK